VFSPYYHWARARGRAAAENHVAFNVALYGPARRWTMTERSARALTRSADELAIGPSRMRWDGSALSLELDEIGMPIPRRVLGSVRLRPLGLSTFATTLDAAGRHRWGPIAPCARVEVAMHAPALRWSGHAYLDSNEGDEPIARAFTDWDWSRALLADGGTAVIYDVRPRDGAERVIAQRFHPDGRSEPFDAPPRRHLPRTGWRLDRQVRSEGDAPRLLQTLEDTPFYTRSLLRTQLLGEPVTSVHETLSVPRLERLSTRLMLPWRMPRRR
jgi:carotenoid 1,2-hydratase